jgi:hypothetical protein
MQRLLGGGSGGGVGGGSPQPGGDRNLRNSGAAVNSSPVPRLQIGARRNLGACIRTAATAGDGISLTEDGRRSFCLAYHYVGRCNLNCCGKLLHCPLSGGGEQRLHAWKIRWIDPPAPRPPRRRR